VRGKMSAMTKSLLAAYLNWIPSRGAAQSSRGDRRLTFPNDLLGLRLFNLAIAQVVDFTADTFFASSTLA
jgi:hypothetical protein